MWAVTLGSMMNTQDAQGIAAASYVDDEAGLGWVQHPHRQHGAGALVGLESLRACIRARCKSRGVRGQCPRGPRATTARSRCAGFLWTLRSPCTTARRIHRGIAAGHPRHQQRSTRHPPASPVAWQPAEVAFRADFEPVQRSGSCEVQLRCEWNRRFGRTRECAHRARPQRARRTPGSGSVPIAWFGPSVGAAWAKCGSPNTSRSHDRWR